MRLLVCGSRHFQDYARMKEVLDGYTISTIIHGGARGADTLAGRYAEERSIPILRFDALWDLYGRRAGPIRNRQMLREGNPDRVVAFLGPNSRGTADMIRASEEKGIQVDIVEV